ncbi:MAG: patatin [Gammaproteobacteria bacterium]|nr:patatin [Gammaproteobacteria bacterium]NIR98407.1 patatin [Gammaproteobacteria bacterium]NIT64161.1 patatin [Gammaproteobacteria bacterium]NIV21098.1 patatin [Gammaproteobacteria bacterium]NIY32741.1 patatin [Gammaproteobacteria bacterium]
MSRSGERIGLVLGSGSARGWAHIGVLRELGAAGVGVDAVCGASIGALIGGIYACGGLNMLEEWARGLDRADIIRYLDIRLLAQGGFAEAGRLMDYFRSRLGDPDIASLGVPFAAVATDLVTGEEVALRKGKLFDTVRASLALPGLLTPMKLGERWLLDGGLVNPVPVSLCRALGAERVIAVNLNADIVGRRISGISRTAAAEHQARPETTLVERLAVQLRQQADVLKTQVLGDDDRPGLFDVVSSSVHIMQDRITRGRLDDDPPDVLLEPRLSAIGLLEFDRAAEAIAAGRDCARQALPGLRDALGAEGNGPG